MAACIALLVLKLAAPANVAGTWSTTWTLQSALRYTGFLILDAPVYGLLNTGKLAF